MNEDNRLRGVSVTSAKVATHSHYNQVLHLPTGMYPLVNFERQLLEFIKSDTTQLTYKITPEINHVDNSINIYVCPVPESA